MLGYDFWSNASDEMEIFAASNLTVEVKTNMGIIPRAMIWLFHRISLLRGSSVNITVSYVEIYNEKLIDLLNVNAPIINAGTGTFKLTSKSASSNLEIRETKKGEIIVAGLTQVQVRHIEEVMQVLWAGARARSIAATDMNEYSSRSHTIFQVQLDIRSNFSSLPKRTKLSLVDLAGSEKWKGHQIANFSNDRIKEFTSINKSLSALGNCISALMQSSRGHIPYRDSKLTRSAVELLIFTTFNFAFIL